jgi:NAD(P)H dehydrogenase (quinone)
MDDDKIGATPSVIFKCLDCHRNSVKVLVLYYSSYGHMYEMAKEIAAGAKEAGAEVSVKKVPELVPASIIAGNAGLKRGAELQKDVPIVTIDELPDYDAIIFGSPTRFGNMASQMKNFIDQTGGLWSKRKLVDKVAGFFTGASEMHGGHESTLLTMMVPLMHHGMIIVPLGSNVPEIGSTQAGGTPYGPSVLAGSDNSRQMDQTERKLGRDYGRRVAEIAKRLAKR